MRIVLIVAMAANRVIGQDGELPWRIPEDLKFFRRVTMGKPIIMGRKTWESLGRALHGRTNIVVTRNADYAAEGARVAASLDDALALAAGENATEAMVIGGGEIYRLALDKADRIYLTEVHREIEGDTYFPDLGEEWVETERNGPFTVGHGILQYSFVTLDRR